MKFMGHAVAVRRGIDMHSMSPSMQLSVNSARVFDGNVVNEGGFWHNFVLVLFQIVL